MPLRPLPLALLLATLASTAGCAARQGPSAGGATAAGPPPVWATPEGRRDARLEVARLLLDMDRAHEALVVLAEARRDAAPRAGADPELDVLQARAFHSLGMLSEADALVAPHLERPPRKGAADLYRVAGLVRYDQGRLAEAEALLAAAREARPTDFEAVNNLGFLLLVQGRPDEALPVLREAVRLDPQEPRARNNLGFALAALGREQEALGMFRTAGPEAEALLNMGLASERRGDSGAAASWYHRALEANPEHEAAHRALQRIQPSSTGVSP